MPSSPAQVVHQLFIANGIGSRPPATAEWLVYRNREPTDPSVQDDVVTVIRGPDGKTDPMLLAGKHSTHPAIHVRVRAAKLGDESGWDRGNAKGQEIIDLLESLEMELVVVPGDGTPWVIQGWTGWPAGLVHLEEQEKNKRQVFVLNGHITLLGG